MGPNCILHRWWKLRNTSSRCTRSWLKQSPALIYTLEPTCYRGQYYRTWCVSSWRWAQGREWWLIRVPSSMWAVKLIFQGWFCTSSSWCTKSTSSVLCRRWTSKHPGGGYPESEENFLTVRAQHQIYCGWDLALKASRVFRLINEFPASILDLTQIYFDTFSPYSSKYKI